VKAGGFEWRSKRINVKADEATFIIKRSNDPGWKQHGRDLQKGREVGHLGHYAPEIINRGNLIVSIRGIGYVYPMRN
jgi:hypothetical protein